MFSYKSNIFGTSPEGERLQQEKISKHSQRSKSCQNYRYGPNSTKEGENSNERGDSNEFINDNDAISSQHPARRFKSQSPLSKRASKCRDLKNNLFSLYNFMERRKMMKPVVEQTSTLRRGACPQLREKTFPPNGGLNGDCANYNSDEDTSDFPSESLDVRLIEALEEIFPTKDKRLSQQAIFTYLINLRAFITPAEIMQKFFQHCVYEQHNNFAKNFCKENHWKMFQNVLEFCQEWAQSIPYDFFEESMRKRLIEIFKLFQCERLESGKDMLKTQQSIDNLLDNLINALDRLERYENAIQNLQLDEERTPIQSSNQIGLICLCVNPTITARQLTHIELERLSMIGADEFAYVSKLKPSSHKKELYTGHNSPKNIQHYIDWFDQLSQFTATEILRHARKRHRVKCIEYFIDVANECINIGNFNSLMAIVAGLHVQPVHRLKRTWSRVEKSKLEILQHQLDPTGNFLSYRATLKAAIWRAKGAKNASERLIIPFFGLQLKDLYWTARKCRQPLSNGHFNVLMFTEFSDQIKNLNEWKSRICPFKKSNIVLQYLLLTPNFSEKDMFMFSFQYEPPISLSEREHHQKILNT